MVMVNSPASGSPSFRRTNVRFFSWSRIAIFVGVLRYTLSTFSMSEIRIDTNKKKEPYDQQSDTNF